MFKIFPHDQYNPGDEKSFDILVLKTDQPFFIVHEARTKIQTIQLAQSGYVPAGKTNFYVKASGGLYPIFTSQFHSPY